MKKSLLVLFGIIVSLTSLFAQEKRAYRAPEFAYNWAKPGLHPDHIVLNLTADPSTSMSVTWRTNTDIQKGYAEIALATAAPKFWRNATTYKALTETMDALKVEGAETVSNYHSVTFNDLLPDTLYAYRVGNGSIWSEWIQFRTAAKEPKSFSFLYVGDAQNFVLELWSRLIREGYRIAPDAGFIIHAGDLINNAHNERQWHEWFSAGGWIHRMLPSISTPGNHEYSSRNETEREQRIRELSVQWRPQFTLPPLGVDSLETLEETTYYLDYQDTRIISLNSNRMIDEQVPWLEEVLENNPNTWTVITFHHPIYSASERRNNGNLRNKWKPIFDKYKVDLVLQGHDHSYARGRSELPEENIVSGMNARDYTGTVYVVSVSGGKMYRLRPNAWEDFEGAERDRGAENTQLFQLIKVDGKKLSFEAYTPTGELYDAFDLLKSEDGKPNRFIEKKGLAVPPRRHENTISYEDQLPEDIKKSLLEQYPDWSVSNVRYFDEPEFRGYKLRLYKETSRIDLVLDAEGEILEVSEN
ncbi:MAG: metallophosphoesterase family protein [Bacteroidota bacterium]